MKSCKVVRDSHARKHKLFWLLTIIASQLAVVSVLMKIAFYQNHHCSDVGLLMMLLLTYPMRTATGGLDWLTKKTR